MGEENSIIVSVILYGTKKLPFHPIIRVYECDIFTFCNIQTIIPCGDHTAICLMNDLYSAVFLSIVVAYMRTEVTASVINKDELEICERLREDALYASSQIFLCIVNRNDNGYF